MKGTDKEETSKGEGGKIALVPHASSASCLGVISNAGEAKASGGGMGDTQETGVTAASQEMSASAHFSLFFFRQTQDVDESQVSEKDKEHKTEVVQQSTTCRFLLL